MQKTTPSFYFLLMSRLRGKSFLYEFYFKNKKTLDVGCGEGEFLSFDKELIHGVDKNPRVIDRLGREGFSVTCADVAHLPYPDATYEMVHCHNVIEHLTVDEACRMLTEIGRVLKPQGQLVLSSEVVTSKFWDTFGHIKPYPPEAVIKLLREQSREAFDGLGQFEYSGLFYLGDYFHNKLLYLCSAALGFFTPLQRREYFLVLRRRISL